MTEKRRRYYMYTLVANLYHVYSYQIADTPRPFYQWYSGNNLSRLCQAWGEIDRNLAAGQPQGWDIVASGRSRSPLPPSLLDSRGLMRRWLLNSYGRIARYFV